MININQKDFRKNLLLIESISGDLSIKNVKFYCEGGNFVLRTIVGCQLIKLKTPIISKTDDIAFCMTKEQYLLFLNKMNTLNGEMSISLESTKLSISLYKKTKVKNKENQMSLDSDFMVDCSEFYYKKKDTLALTAKSLNHDFDEFLDFIKALKKLKTNNQFLTYLDFASIVLKNNELRIYVNDEISSICYKVRLSSKNQTENILTIELSKLMMFANLVSKSVDMEINFLIYETGIVLETDTVDYFIPKVDNKNLSVEEIFNHDKRVLFDDGNEFYKIKNVLKDDANYQACKSINNIPIHINRVAIKNVPSSFLFRIDENYEVSTFQEFTKRMKEEAYIIGYSLWYILTALSIISNAKIRETEEHLLFIGNEFVEWMICPVVINKTID